MSRPIKRSLTLARHRTSVSLEKEFWDAFRQIARMRGASVNALATEIDAARDLDTGLATAIRLFVLKELQEGLAAARREPAARYCFVKRRW